MKELQIILIVVVSMILASLMAVVGAFSMAKIYPNPLFGKYDFVFPSLLTWIGLMWTLRTPSQKFIWITGLESPFVGAAWTLVLKSGPIHGIQYPSRQAFVGGLTYATIFVFLYAPITFPVGVTTAFLIRGVWKVIRTT